MLILTYAPWCEHCKNLMPTWQKLKNQYGRKINFKEINYDKNPEAAKELGVKGFPTIMFLYKGKKYEYNGDRSIADLSNFAEATLIAEKKV